MRPSVRRRRSCGRSLLPAARRPPPPARPRRAPPRRRPPGTACRPAGRPALAAVLSACRSGPPARSRGRTRGRSWRTAAADSRPSSWPCRPSSGSSGWCSGPSRRWPAGCRRSARPRASPAAGGTGGCRRRSSRCSAAAPRHTGYPAPGCSCRCRSARRARPVAGAGCPGRPTWRLWTATPRSVMCPAVAHSAPRLALHDNKPTWHYTTRRRENNRVARAGDDLDGLRPGPTLRLLK